MLNLSLEDLKAIEDRITNKNNELNQNVEFLMKYLFKELTFLNQVFIQKGLISDKVRSDWDNNWKDRWDTITIEDIKERYKEGI